MPAHSIAPSGGSVLRGAAAGGRSAGRSATAHRSQGLQATNKVVVASAARVDVKPVTRVTLGSSDLKVSEVCLGTMTFGVQNTEAEAHQQLDLYVKERDCNFIDTAEMYPVPTTDPRWKSGTTEEYIGTWLEANPGKREEVIIATKIAGFMPESPIAGNRYDPPMEKADSNLTADQVKMACDASLRRLKTDYIDLYQTHWPSRYLATFGKSAYNPEMERVSDVPLKETCLAMKQLVEAGKIRHWGLSNESTFGVCEVIRACEAVGAPYPISIQNSFSLMHRGFETELAEACAPNHHNISLLPWSPLAGGMLSGKYLDGALPENSRFALYPQFMARFQGEPAVRAAKEYKRIADEAGMSMATLALAWCKSRWYVGSTIIGATSMDQLQENMDAFAVDLSPEVMEAIDKVHLLSKDPVIEL